MYADIKLGEGWDNLIGAFEKQAAFEKILTLLTAVGALLVVMAVVKWFWDKRRGGGGGGGGNSSVGWALAVGALLAAPQIIIPVILDILDVVANAFVDVFDGEGD